MSHFPHIESLKVQLVQPSALVTIRYNLPLCFSSSWNKNTAHSAYAFKMPQKVGSGVGGLWSHGAPQLVSTLYPAWAEGPFLSSLGRVALRGSHDRSALCLYDS